MRTSLFLFLLLCSMSALFGQDTKMQQLVIGPIDFDTNDPRSVKIKRLVRTASYAAFNECGCSNILVQRKHRHKGKISEDEIAYLDKIQNLLINRFTTHESSEAFSAKDQEKTQYLGSKVLTRYLSFGKLVQDPYNAVNEFSLEIHTIDLETWTHAIPGKTLYFTIDEIQDFISVKSKIVSYLNAKKDDKFCTPKVYGRYWGVVPGSERSTVISDNPSNDNAPRTGTAISQSIKDTVSISDMLEPSVGEPTPEDLNKVVRYLILLEWYYPDNKNILKAKEDYVKNPTSKGHYLQQKLILFADIFSDLSAEEINMTDPYAQEILNILIDTLYKLIPIIEDPEQKEMLREMKVYYTNFK